MTKTPATLLFCGSADWDLTGRKKATEEYPGFVVYAPTSQLSLVLAATSYAGNAYTFGRNDKGQLGDGSFKSRSQPFKVSLPKKFVHAATGRNHTLLVAEDGTLYSTGENKACQLGHALNANKDQNTFELVSALKDEKIVRVACGVDFSIAITDKGTVWSWGNPQYGQLGHGSDQQHIGKGNKIIFEPQVPKAIARLKEKNIVDVQCGYNHSLALDDTGSIYVWGGYGRLGLNETPPRDVMVPTEVSGFKNRNNFVKKIACGPTCCMVTDSRDGLYVWGKWKTSGDGGQGTPWLYPKYFDGLSGWKIDDIACGGVSLFALSETSTISWGQNAANGELGHGKGKPKSATNAVKVDALEDANTLAVSCGLGHTLVLVDSSKTKLIHTSVEDAVLEKLEKSQGEPANFDAPADKKRKAPDANKSETKKSMPFSTSQSR